MAPLQVPWMEALGWALLHSLWQGLVLAALAWVLLRQVSSARLRCSVAYAALALTALSAGITFGVMLPQTPAPALAASGGAPGAGPTWRHWLPLASLAWFAGVAITGTRLGLGWAWLRNLRRTGTIPAEAAWQARLDHLAERLGLPRPIRLLCSTRITSPMVLGWLRPVVLVPASAFLGLSPSALEAILAHELAHIRRLDYLFNLLQNLLETLLFYHPAAWWLSRQIRQERENAADDLAIALVGNPLQYARALTDLEALRSLPSTPLQLAPAATGGSLMNRIRRILLPPAPPLPSARAGLLAALAVTTLGACTAVGFAEEKPPETRRMVLQEGDKRIDLQLKGDAKLDPKSEHGVSLGEGASLELTVREAPVRKKVTLRKDAKGIAKVLTENGAEKPIQGADEAWLKQVLGELKGMEGKVEPGKARTFRLELEEEGKDGRPRVFTYRTGGPEGHPWSGTFPSARVERFVMRPRGEAFFHFDSEFSDHLDALKKHGRELYFKSRVEKGKDGALSIITEGDETEIRKHVEEARKAGKKISETVRIEIDKDGKRHVMVGEAAKKHLEGLEKDGPKIRVTEDVLQGPTARVAPKARKEIRIEAKVEEGKDGQRKVIIREGDKVTERELSGPGTVWLSTTERSGSGDPKMEAEHLRAQIERLQKRLKDVEAKAKAAPEKK